MWHAQCPRDSGSRARDDHLRSADFFDTAHHPTATFTGHAATWQGTRGVLEGELTIRGVARPVTLRVEYLGHAADPLGAATGPSSPPAAP